MATCAIENHREAYVVEQLNELFGNVLNLDVIKRVAVSCRYDVIESSNKLLEISSSSGEKIMEKKREREVIFTTFRGITLKQVTQPEPMSPSASCVTPKKSKKAANIERAINYILKGYKVLVLMRGVPGCGKSYLAKHILDSTIGCDINSTLHILSTDDYFSQNGFYQFDADNLSKAHGWNHNRAFHAFSRGFSPIIIDNTNVQMWEMKPYAMMATDYGYIIEIIEPDTHWCFNDKELAKRNRHGVSRAKIKEMLERYEKNITPVKLLNAYNLSYRLQKPPQWRLYPPLSVTVNKSQTNTDTNITGNNSPKENIFKKSRTISALNCETQAVEVVDAVETIDLMEFNDDETTSERSQAEMLGNEPSKSSWNQTLVDDILMCTVDSSTDKTTVVLQPSQSTTEIVTISDSSDDDSRTPQVERKMFPDMETAWGINENALRSWDIVTPIKDEGNMVKIPQQTVERKVVTNDTSCNTEEEYFQLVREKPVGYYHGFVKIIETVSRDINRSTPKKEPAVLKKLMLDKSCLTEDIFENYDNHMSQLINLFPSVPNSHLNYWYNKCKGDLEWTIEFLLEAKEEINTLIEENNIDDTQADDETLVNADDESSSSDNEEIVTKSNGKPKRIRKTSDENIDLKKLIESKIDINNEYYSKHLLKVKNFKFGNGNSNLDNQKPSMNQDEICSLRPLKSPSPKPCSSKHEDSAIYVEDSDIDFDEYDIVDYVDKPEEKSEETTELNLGEHFVAQLEEKFGDPNIAYPKGFQPVVQVPVALARQLYTFYIESVYQQMDTQKQVLDTLIKEDEEFAKKLQAKEEEEVSSQVKPTLNLREIMDEQVAQNIYQKEVDNWKKLNPDNIAARLTRQKLFKIFPNIVKDVLTEILYAHGNKYQDTVDILLASTGLENVQGSIESIREPPLKDEVLQEMKEAQLNSGSKEYEEQQEATFYREEANGYLKKRAELYQKAQQYHQRGMTEVAQFYSGLASQQTVYFDRANSMAATAFLDEHAKRLQDFNTIDLHFLYVKEAIPALDVFLDRNINLLRHSTTKQSEYLQIITGRGKRSENGVSKIRPAVMTRLKKRGIKFVQLNPGLLKAKVSKTSLVTSEILNE